MTHISFHNIESVRVIDETAALENGTEFSYKKIQIRERGGKLIEIDCYMVDRGEAPEEPPCSSVTHISDWKRFFQ